MSAENQPQENIDADTAKISVEATDIESTEISADPELKKDVIQTEAATDENSTEGLELSVESEVELQDFDLDSDIDELELSEDLDELEEDGSGLSEGYEVQYDHLPLKTAIEACIFASPKPVKIEEIMGYCASEEPKTAFLEAIDELVAEYEERAGGFRLRSIKNVGYQFQTEETSAYLMGRMFSQRPKPISKAALETLAIVAYRQPCTRAVVDYIRGVDSGSIIKNLMERELIKCVGRREDAGRPMLFGTTDEFLNVFGLKSLEDMPTLQSFQPSSDTMKQALDELDELEKVDIEEFIADEDADEPEFSDGLSEDDVQVNVNELELASDESPEPSESSQTLDKEDSLDSETLH